MLILPQENFEVSNTLMYFDDDKDYNEYDKYDNSVDFSKLCEG